MLRIESAIESGALEPTFRARDLNAALGITWGGTFLVEHCQDTGRLTPRFRRVGAGVYQLIGSGKA